MLQDQEYRTYNISVHQFPSGLGTQTRVNNVVERANNSNLFIPLGKIPGSVPGKFALLGSPTQSITLTLLPDRLACSSIHHRLYTRAIFAPISSSIRRTIDWVHGNNASRLDLIKKWNGNCFCADSFRLGMSAAAAHGF